MEGGGGGEGSTTVQGKMTRMGTVRCEGMGAVVGKDGEEGRCVRMICSIIRKG